MRRKLLAVLGSVSLLAAGLASPVSAAPAAPDPNAIAIPAQPSNIEGFPDFPALTVAQVEADNRAAADIRAKVADAKAKGLRQVGGLSDEASPLPPVKGAKLATCTGPCYAYLVGSQVLTDAASGASAVMTTNKPYVASTPVCNHSLAEISLHNNSAGGDDTVEVGWRVDKCARADGTPVLFASAWDDGVWFGYNGTGGWIDEAGSPDLGAGVASPLNHTYAIGSSSTYWYAGWQSLSGPSWVARLPKSVFAGGTEFGVSGDSVIGTQFFWELATEVDDPCDDFGSGLDSTPVQSGTSKIVPNAFPNSANAVNLSNVQRLLPSGSTYPNDNRAAIEETPANTLRGSGPMYGPTGAPSVGASGLGCS